MTDHVWKTHTKVCRSSDVLLLFSLFYFFSCCLHVLGWFTLKSLCLVG